MGDPTGWQLTDWENFYIIVGPSSAALIGLQFVVITLLSDARLRRTPRMISAFATPTVVHFVVTLVVSAIMTTPWRSRAYAADGLVACGVAGLLYGGRVALRARQQTAYEPVWQDWVWHVVLPSIAYAALGVAALRARGHAGDEVFAVAACALTLLLIGIHNAWDAVTYIVAHDGPGAGDDAGREDA